MSSGLHAGLARSPRLFSVVPALAVAVSLLGACFDSDEKPVPLDFTTSTTTGVVPTTTGSSTTSGGSTSTGKPDVTCRDAIDCVVGCAGELQQSKLPEPDLTCFLDCEEDLTVGEALHLFRLTECVTEKCITNGVCDFLVPTDPTGSSSGGESSSSGGESSSSGGSSSTGGSSSDGEPPPPTPQEECLTCILANMRDPEPGGVCQPLADACV